MKKCLFSFFVLLLAAWTVNAQTTILDFESAASSTTFQYFGSPLDGSLNQTIANPNPSGINTSGTVSQFLKPAVAEVWAGAFSNPNPATPVDLIANSRVTLKVHMDHIGSVSLKLEGSTDGGDNWLVTVPNTKVNEWEELTFDVSLPSLEPPFTAAAGHTYTRIVLFFDFGTPGTGTEQTYYIDDIVAAPAADVTTTVLDFETTESGTAFQYFGSPLDGTFTQIIDNPNASGINTSSKVVQYVKPGVSEVWAGAFSNPNPTVPVDLSNGGQICIKVHMDHIGNLALKLEQAAGGQANWIQTVANTKVGEWEELCFDATLPSLEPPFEAATGAVYSRVVLFFDFGTPGTGTDVTSYFDDIVVKSSGAPQARTVHFRVDMNNYAENFDQVYVSGTFNNWSGDANPLSDPEFDGIWEGEIVVPNGSYEYKVTLDNWAAQENFLGTEECTKVDPSGQFVNRQLLVSADTELPQFCFNSCYACGEEVKITFRLGMGSVTPNPEGVWLAGGGNFDVPGGKYRMRDNDGDGVYEVVIPRREGFQSFYTFANGPCPDYSCKENIEGQDCANPGNFNDRLLPAVQADTVVATCFGICSDNTDCVIISTKAPIEDESVFNILGNPSNGLSVLEFGANIENDEKTILLTNALGQTLGQWSIGAGQQSYSLTTNHLQSGIYFITVYSGNRFFTRKMVR